jgi:hypothetical protein
MNEQSKKQNEDPIFGKVISVYTQDQAIEDGVLVLTGYVGKERVVFTRHLFSQGFEDETKRRELVEKGLQMLRLPDPEDSPSMRLRVIEEGKIWVIWNQGEGFVFLAPEDY